MLSPVERRDVVDRGVQVFAILGKVGNQIEAAFEVPVLDVDVDHGLAVKEGASYCGLDHHARAIETKANLWMIRCYFCHACSDERQR